MADNPFTIKVPNALEALMAGEQGYTDMSAQIKERQLGAVRQQAAQDIMQGGNPQDALARLLSIGDNTGAQTLATVLHNKTQAAYQQQQLGLQGQQLTETTRHNKASEAATADSQNKPIILPYGSGLVDRSGKIIREPTTDGLLDPDTVTAMANQLRAGDTSVLANLGRGAQGAQNVIAVRKKVAELNAAGGETGAEQASRNAEFFGTKAGQRTLGAKSANIEMAATEFNQILPIVAEASRAVNRTNYPDLNRIIQAFETKTGDPAIVKFGGGVNTLVNLYARAISPTGNPTVSDKDHAREILSKSWAQGQFDAAVGMMKQEIDAALNSPEKVREDMRRRFLGGQQPLPSTQQQPSAQPAAQPALPQLPPGFQLVK